MFALVVNDDGLRSEGLAALEQVARGLFDRVVVVAPRWQRSGQSQAITLNRSFRLIEERKDVWAVEGTPADCVFFGVRELTGGVHPDFVLSGVNLGPNLGYDTLYSGTVAAAREGLMHGIPSIAFSLGVMKEVSFDQARPHLEHVLRMAMERGLPRERMLNVNIPSLEAFGPVKGYRECSIGTRVFLNKTCTWRDPLGNLHGWIGGREFTLAGDETTDCYWVQRGFVTMSLLTWNLGAASIGELKSWEQG